MVIWREQRLKIALHQITSLHAPFEEDMQAYKNTGWTSFELLYDKADAYIKPHGLKQFITLVKKSGLKPIACSGHYILSFASAVEIKANSNEFTEKLNLLEALACPLIVVGADSPSGNLALAADGSEKELFKRDQAYRAHLSRFADQIGRLADLAEKKSVAIALELNWCGLCRSVKTAAEVIQMVARDNVGFIFDFAHFAQTPSRLSDLDSLKGKIIAAHLNDLRNAPPEILNVNSDRVVPGDGILPIMEWMKKIEELGFDGYYSIEIFNEDLWKHTPREIAAIVLNKCRKLWPHAQF